jgi:hypothetical protein
MNDKYKLLKDLPDLKAGAIFTYVYAQNGRHFYIQESANITILNFEYLTPVATIDSHQAHMFATDYVTKNPEWFEKVK